MAGQAEPVYEVLALRFASHSGRAARQNFLVLPDGIGPEAPMPLDFYIWVIRDDRHTLLVDTGFGRHTAARRDRDMFLSPADGLAAAGISPGEITDVVITHMHYDHAGGLDVFGAARIHVQEAELAFCTGPGMRHRAVRLPFEGADAAALVRRLHDGQVVLHKEKAEIIPGVSVHPVGGHTPGLQVVRVPTKRGWIVLASDAAHLWANIRLRSPFPIFDNLSSVAEAYDVVETLCAGPDHVIPGHDPQVATRFPRSEQSPHWFLLHEPPIAEYFAHLTESGAAR